MLPLREIASRSRMEPRIRLISSEEVLMRSTMLQGLLLRIVHVSITLHL